LLTDEMKARTVIAGVSPDPVEKFREVIPKVTARSGKEFLVTLLADPRHEAIDRYGLLNEQAAARGRFLPHPTTYVIDRTGVVRWKFTEKDYRVRPANAQILEQLRKLK